MLDLSDPKVKEVLEVEREWVLAIRNKDLAAMERILADDYTQILSTGEVIGKQAALDAYRAEDRFWEAADSLDHDIRIYGDTAVMIARWVARGENHGERFDYQARFLAVFVQRGGRWQMAADLSTAMEA